jgi:hypothetical protein
LTAADFDGDGNIWYKGPASGDLVKYVVATGVATTIPYSTTVAMYETRLAYDPVTNSIAYGGYSASSLVVYDIDTGVFTVSSLNPGGNIKDTTCGDRSGHVYAGSTAYTQVYQYDVAANTWTLVALPPFAHDNNSSCTVSQDGWYYFSNAGSFARLALGSF